MILPSQYIHHTTASVKGIPLAIRPCLHEYGRDPAGVDLRCARGDVGCQLRRISASRRLAVLVRGVVSEEFVAMRSTRQKAVLMVSIVHGGFHPLGRASPVPRRPARRASIAGRCAPSNAAVPTPACRHCRDVGAWREGPITWQTMAKGLEIKRSRTTPCRPSEHTPRLQRLIPRETEVLLIDRRPDLAAEAFLTPSSRKLRPRSPSRRAPGERDRNQSAERIAENPDYRPIGGMGRGSGGERPPMKADCHRPRKRAFMLRVAGDSAEPVFDCE
jgi:hypothetical protein